MKIQRAEQVAGADTLNAAIADLDEQTIRTLGEWAMARRLDVDIHLRCRDGRADVELGIETRRGAFSVRVFENRDGSLVVAPLTYFPL